MNAFGPCWRAPADPATFLSPGQVHLWRADLRLDPSYAEHLSTLLSPDEKARARRFRFPKDRLRFTAARGILRQLLGSYTRRPASSLVFGYGPAGKPFLLNENGAPSSLEFNLAHSHDRALFAFALHSPLGVDLEQIRPEVPVEKLAERFFAPAEAGALLRLPPSERRPAFFRAWTRKEAFLKALGLGIHAGLAACQVSLEPGSQDALLSFQNDPQFTLRWLLLDLVPHPDFAAALAVHRPLPELCLWDWTPPPHAP